MQHVPRLSGPGPSRPVGDVDVPALPQLHPVRVAQQLGHHRDGGRVLPAEQPSRGDGQQVDRLEHPAGAVPEVVEALVDAAVGRERGEIAVLLGDGEREHRIPGGSLLLIVQQEQRSGDEVLMDPAGPVVHLGSHQPVPVAAFEDRVDHAPEHLVAGPVPQARHAGVEGVTEGQIGPGEDLHHLGRTEIHHRRLGVGQHPSAAAVRLLVRDPAPGGQLAQQQHPVRRPVEPSALTGRHGGQHGLAGHGAQAPHPLLMVGAHPLAPEPRVLAEQRDGPRLLRRGEGRGEHRFAHRRGQGGRGAVRGEARHGDPVARPVEGGGELRRQRGPCRRLGPHPVGIGRIDRQPPGGAQRGGHADGSTSCVKRSAMVFAESSAGVAHTSSLKISTSMSPV